MKSTRLATLCVALGLASFLSVNARAAIYSDASNDLFDNGLSNLDITSFEVTNSATSITFTVTTRGFQNWTKYLIGIRTAAAASAPTAATTGNAWGRNGTYAEGINYQIASWVDGGGGVQLVPYTNGAWDFSSTGGATLDLTQTGANKVSWTVSLSALGLVPGNTIKFDVGTTGGTGGDPFVDVLSRSVASTSGWAVASTGGPMLSYTVAALADSDNDGLTDTWENTYFGNLDQVGSGDPDADNLTNSGELTAGTNPTVADTDGDGLNDGAEVTTHTTNPLVADTDGDGVNDAAEIAAGTNPKKINYSTITVAGSFQGWSPTPTNNPSNVMNKVTGEEFGWELNFRMSSATNYLGKFVNGTAFSAPNNVNWGTSATPGTASLGGYGNDIPFNVTATGVYRFYFNTDTLSYSFTRAAAPATYAAWAAQYGLAAGSEAVDGDVDGLSNQLEFSLNLDPANDDTDGDGLTDGDETAGTTSGNYFFDANFNSVLIPTNPMLADSDGDGLGDRWEILNYLDPSDDGTVSLYADFTGLPGLTSNPNGATSDPDGDGLTNLQEQTANENPLAAGTGLASTYAKMVVAGSFVKTKPDGAWDEVGNAVNTMQLVSNFTWKLIVYVPAPLPSFAQFKFTTGSWGTNFGDNIPSGESADGIGDLNGTNINALPAFTAAGYYMITFNDYTKAYTIAPLAAADGDSDGLPDAWEAFYGSYLEPKLTDLVPGTAYLAGSPTTAAQAYEAGSNPVRDTVAPTLGLATGVDLLTWVPLGTGVTPGVADVVAADVITLNPTVIFSPASVDTSLAGTTVITYTATDAGGNATTLQRTVVVGDAAPGWRAMVWPPTLAIHTLGTGDAYGQIYVDGATSVAGAAPNIQAWVGVSSANTDPATWDASAWTAAAFHSQQFANDEYKGTISGAGLTPGTPYYYAYRWQIGSGVYTYGGIKADGTGSGPWDGTTNVNGVLTVQAARQITFAVNMNVQIFKGEFNPAVNGVEVRGDFNNFSGGSALSDADADGIYTGTFAVGGAENAEHAHKFVITGPSNYAEWEFNVGTPPGNRKTTLLAGGTAMSLPIVFFSDISETRKISISVDMSKQIEKGNFNPTTNSVSVISSATTWTPPGVALAPAPGLGVNIYALDLFVDGPLPDSVEYKFFNNAVGAPNMGYEASANRVVVKADIGAANLSTTTIPTVLFSNDDGLYPTEIGLSASAIAENNAVNDVIGTLSATDLTAGDTFTFALVAGTGDTDNASFNISGSSLRASQAFDHETKSSYSVRIQVTDRSGTTFAMQFAISVTDVAEGTTFAGWAGGAELNSANLGKYAIGGASSPTATDGVNPTSTVSGGNLVLTAIVRVDDAKVSVVGEAVTSLADYAPGGTVSTVNGLATVDQTGVPAGCEKQAFTVAQDGARKFLRLKATLAP